MCLSDSFVIEKLALAMHLSEEDDQEDCVTILNAGDESTKKIPMEQHLSQSNLMAIILNYHGNLAQRSICSLGMRM